MYFKVDVYMLFESLFLLFHFNIFSNFFYACCSCGDTEQLQNITKIIQNTFIYFSNKPFFSFGQDYIDQTEIHHSWCVLYYIACHVLRCNRMWTVITKQKGKEDRSVGNGVLLSWITSSGTSFEVKLIEL